MTAAPVRVRLFGRHREVAGEPEILLHLPEGSTVGDLRAQLSDRLGPAAPLRGAAIALNRQYAEESDAVSSGDEAALIPPVAGG